MKSAVINKLTSGRAGMPCGLNPSNGGGVGHAWNIDTVPKWLATKCILPSNSATRPGAPPGAGPNCVIRKRGLVASLTSKKKIPFCPFKTLRRPAQPRIVLLEFKWQ